MDAESIKELKLGFRGEVVLPQDASFKSISSGMANQIFIDRKPAIVCRPRGAADVAKAVKWAAENHLKVVPRSGGHGGSGLAACEGGMLLDLALMKGVTYDPSSTNVTVQSGCRLSDIDYEMLPYQRAVPMGVVGITGIGGLALHGGYGLLTRYYGLTVDNILQVEIVTGKGEILIANEKENTDLFWAVRGAGSNVGVVTNFVFKTHHMPPTVYGGFVIQPALNLIDYHDRWSKKVLKDPNFTCWNYHLSPPTGPECGLVGRLACQFGDQEVAEREMEDLISFAPKAMYGWKHQPFNLLNETTTEFFANAPPMRQYWKAMNFREWNHDLSVAFNDLFAEVRASKFGAQSLLATEYWNSTSTAVQRDMPLNIQQPIYVILMLLGWQDPAFDDEAREFASNVATRFEKLGNIRDQTYFNYSPEDNAEYSLGKKNLERLLTIKSKYDPLNLFDQGSLRKRKFDPQQHA
jgi:hypothetical protein